MTNNFYVALKYFFLAALAVIAIDIAIYLFAFIFAAVIAVPFFFLYGVFLDAVMHFPKIIQDIFAELVSLIIMFAGFFLVVLQFAPIMYFIIGYNKSRKIIKI